MKIYQPKGFDCNETAKYIGHMLYHQIIFGGLQRDGTMTISSKYLQGLCGYNYNRDIEEAIKGGFIKRSNGYRHVPNAGKCKEFSLGEAWQHQPTYLEKMPAGDMWDRIAKSNEKYKRLEEQRLSPELRQMRADSRKITIKDVPWEDITFKAGKDRELQLNCVQHQFNKIRRRHWIFYPSQWGRIHTNMTSLAKVVVPFIRLDGSTLTQIDIKSSQVCFLILILRKILTSQHTVKQFKHQHLEDILLSWRMTTFNNQKSRVFQAQKQLTTIENEIEAGTIYESMSGAATKEERDKAKTDFFTYCFGRNGIENMSSRWFEENVPLIHEIIRQIKWKNYKTMVRELQWQESQFMFYSVVPRIRQKFPKIRIITKHDAVLVGTDYDADKIEHIFVDEFFKLGITAKVTTTAQSKPSTEKPRYNTKNLTGIKDEDVRRPHDEDTAGFAIDGNLGDMLKGWGI